MTLAFDILVLGALALALGRGLLLLLLAAGADRLTRALGPALLQPPGDPGNWPRLSVILPAFNEQRCVGHTLRALLASDYPHLAIIVVDDGSTDATAELVEKCAAADPRVMLLRHRQNRGKAAALNSGVHATTSELCAMIDADTVVESNTITRLVATLVAEQATAVAGNVKVENRLSLLGLFQSIEYVTNLHLDRRTQNAMGTVTTVPGATCLWRREALLSLGMCVRFADRAVSHTLVPHRLDALHAQRRRWLLGNLQCA